MWNGVGETGTECRVDRNVSQMVADDGARTKVTQQNDRCVTVDPRMKTKLKNTKLRKRDSGNCDSNFSFIMANICQIRTS